MSNFIRLDRNLDKQALPIKYTKRTATTINRKRDEDGRGTYLMVPENLKNAPIILVHNKMLIQLCYYRNAEDCDISSVRTHYICKVLSFGYMFATLSGTLGGGMLYYEKNENPYISQALALDIL